MLLLAAAINFFIPINGRVTGLRTAEAWWGGMFTIAEREPSRWIAVVYLVVAAAFAHGVVAAAQMWRRDRVGGTLAGLAAGGGLVAQRLSLPLPTSAAARSRTWATCRAPSGCS